HSLDYVLCVYRLYYFECVCYLLFFFFFFSSRRRHTRSKRDWSSDVCSSDLASFTSSSATPRPGPGGSARTPAPRSSFSVVMSSTVLSGPTHSRPSITFALVAASMISAIVFTPSPKPCPITQRTPAASAVASLAAVR